MSCNYMWHTFIQQETYNCNTSYLYDNTVRHLLARMYVKTDSFFNLDGRRPPSRRGWFSLPYSRSVRHLRVASIPQKHRYLIRDKILDTICIITFHLNTFIVLRGQQKSYGTNNTNRFMYLLQCITSTIPQFPTMWQMSDNICRRSWSCDTLRSVAELTNRDILDKQFAFIFKDWCVQEENSNVTKNIKCISGACVCASMRVRARVCETVFAANYAWLSYF